MVAAVEFVRGLKGTPEQRMAAVVARIAEMLQEAESLKAAMKRAGAITDKAVRAAELFSLRSQDRDAREACRCLSKAKVAIQSDMNQQRAQRTAGQGRPVSASAV